MALNRDREIASLKKVFKKLAHKGPLSSSYMLPVKSVFGSSNCILEIKVPRGYPDKDVEIKMVNPMPHVWANSYGVITCPDWLRKLPLVYVVEAVLTQFDGYNSSAAAAATAPNPNQHHVAHQVGQPHTGVAATAHNPDDGPEGGSTGAVRTDDNDHDASSVGDTTPNVAAENSTNIDERMLRVCRNPPTGVFQTLLSADREEVMSMLSNEDTRWKILYSCPQLAPMLAELHQLLEENEAAALAVIAAVNKKQDCLKSIEEKIKTMETMEVKPADATKMRKQYLTAYHEHNKATIKALKQQIADKVKAIEQGDLSFDRCYDELSKMHLKCNELSAIELSTLR